MNHYQYMGFINAIRSFWKIAPSIEWVVNYEPNLADDNQHCVLSNSAQTASDMAEAFNLDHSFSSYSEDMDLEQSQGNYLLCPI